MISRARPASPRRPVAPLASAALALLIAMILLAPAVAQPRNVTPPGFTPAPQAEGALTRLPGAAPPPIAPRWRRFFLPATLDAATFQTPGRTLVVAGVVPPAPADTCTGVDGANWPCGRQALTALRMFLRGRAVECFFASDAVGDPLSVPCRVGRTDIAVWLAEQGWAAPAADASEAVVAAADKARCAGRGLFRGRAEPAACAAPTPAVAAAP